MHQRKACRFRRVLIGAVLFAFTPLAAAAQTWHEARPLMGTLVEVQLEGADSQALRRAAGAAYAEMARLTDMMSHFDPKSVVSAINRQAGIAPVAVPPELVEVLTMARRVSQATGGAFDVTVGALGWRFGTEGTSIPDAHALARRRALVDYRDLVVDPARGTVFLRRRGMRLDLGGIAKLYILNAGMEVLGRQGVSRALINGGGDFVVTAPPGADPWRIGIRDPRRRGSVLGAIALRRGLVASSGDYERVVERDGRRLHHVIDPVTAQPAAGLTQVTLVGRTLAEVDGYSAALMVLGYDAARRFLEARANLEAVLVGADARRWSTPGIQISPPTPRDEAG